MRTDNRGKKRKLERENGLESALQECFLEETRFRTDRLRRLPVHGDRGGEQFPVPRDLAPHVSARKWLSIEMDGLLLRLLF